MRFHPQKVRAITALSGPERYSHFIKVAADLRSVCGLYQDGWALVNDAEGVLYLPVWPAAPYAEQCAVSEWESYRPRELELDEFFQELIPKLKESNVGIAVFPTPEQKGVTPELDVLVRDLRMELSRIE